ncbi:hypothetical protein ABZ079_27715 [Streptomyces sp. NPDC006314]|uniref:hypothetical protein n=1 Tax=Streptomyces sp. NPDC006314 TaxID=3154475 RepID=UPI0033A4D1FB
MDERIALSLYDRIFEVISGKDPSTGFPSAFDSATTIFTMAQRGMVLNGADFRNPFTPGNLHGSVESAYHIANLVDAIPALSPVYAPIGGHVSDVYRKIVSGVITHEPPPPPEDQAKRDELKKVLWEQGTDEEGRTVERPTALADAEKKAHADFDAALTTYTATWAAAQADPALKLVWPIVGAQALDGPKRAFADWGAAGRDQVAAAKAQLATMNRGQVARAFQDAQFRIIGFSLARENSLEEFLRTSILPSDWSSSDGSSWPTYNFSQRMHKSEFTSEAQAYGGGAKVQLGLWSVGGGAQHAESREAMSEETKDIGVSFKWRICSVYRKWMDETLFRLPNWSLGSLGGPGLISGGPNPMMPLIPIAVVMVRDVNIRANWSAQDSQHIKEATSGSVSVGWGPFAVSGEYSFSSESKKFTTRGDQQGLTVPDIQVLGFVCLKVPPCPPM